jgi:cell division protein FtsB
MTGTKDLPDNWRNKNKQDTTEQSNDELLTQIKNLTKERDFYKELARQYTQLAAKGFYFTTEELKQHDSKIIENYLMYKDKCK